VYDHSTCELRSFDQQLEDPNLRKIITLEDTNLARASIPTYRSYLNTFFNWAEIKDETEMLGISDENLQIALEEFVKYQNGRVKADLISPNTVPKIFNPITTPQTGHLYHSLFSNNVLHSGHLSNLVLLEERL